MSSPPAKYSQGSSHQKPVLSSAVTAGPKAVSGPGAKAGKSYVNVGNSRAQPTAGSSGISKPNRSVLSR